MKLFQLFVKNNWTGISQNVHSLRKMNKFQMIGWVFQERQIQPKLYVEESHQCKWLPVSSA